MAKGGIKGSPAKDLGNHGFDGGAGDDVYVGTDEGEVINGNDGNDILFGNGGDDFISGGSGDDEIYGGDGNDYIVAWTGNDFADGGDGIDTIRYYGDSGVIDLESGIATINVGDTSFTDIILNFEIVYGTKGDDIITGSSGDEELYGNSGNDIIDGGAGNDFISGDAGMDTITGGAGNDTLSGGKGGAADTFIFNGEDFDNNEVDIILDFGSADSLVLNGLTIIATDTTSNVGGKGKNDTILTVENGDGGVGQIILYDVIFDPADAVFASGFDGGTDADGFL